MYNIVEKILSSRFEKKNFKQKQFDATCEKHECEHVHVFLVGAFGQKRPVCHQYSVYAHDGGWTTDEILV